MKRLSWQVPVMPIPLTVTSQGASCQAAEESGGSLAARTAALRSASLFCPTSIYMFPNAEECSGTSVKQALLGRLRPSLCLFEGWALCLSLLSAR